MLWPNKLLAKYTPWKVLFRLTRPDLSVGGDNNAYFYEVLAIIVTSKNILHRLK